MELKDLLLDAEKDLVDYEDDVKLNVRGEKPQYRDYLESKIAAFKELRAYRQAYTNLGQVNA